MQWCKRPAPFNIVFALDKVQVTMNDLVSDSGSRLVVLPLATLRKKTIELNNGNMCEMQFASSSKNYRRDDGLYAGSKIVEIMITL